MFIGHFAAGLAAKKVDASPSLGTLFMASQFIDLLWPVFLILGLESVKIDPGNTAFTPLDFISYPFTHSLAGTVLWSVLFGFVYYLRKKHIKTAVLLAVLVLSHWLLDFFTHRPDLLLVPGINLKAGMGLWNSVPATIILEGLLFVSGIYLYLRVTKSSNRTGSISFWSLIVFLVIIYISNVIGPPPPSEEAIGYVGLSQLLLVWWGYWIDRNRQAIQTDKKSRVAG